MACDIMVSHPLRHYASTAVRGEPNVSAEGAETAKNLDYRTVCHSAGWGFRPFGLETTGGIGPSAMRTMRQLYRQLSMMAGLPSTQLADQVGRLISLALAKGRGEMLTASNPATKHFI